MKKILFLLILIMSVSSMTACMSKPLDDNGGGGVSSEITIEFFRVYFVIDGETKMYMDVSNMQVFKAPDIPEKEYHTVVGWVNEEGDLHDFSEPLEGPSTLYAKYEVDYKEITNVISSEIMSSNVKIEIHAYNRGGFLNLEKRDVINSVGSGVIFGDFHGNYYVLTNYHVTAKDRKYIEITVVDYKGIEYSAKKQPDTEIYDYDLSTIYFKKGTNILNVLDIARKNPVLTQEIFSLGQPGGQNNTITFGKVVSYENIDLTNGFKPNFKVLGHDAPTAGGSSGGAILDFDFNLVGLHFAGSRDSNGNFIRGFAIPAEIINKYLNEYVYTG